MIKSNYLMIPIQIKALSLSEEADTVAPTGNFGAMPYVGPWPSYHDAGADTANISEEIVSHPFHDLSHRLAQGVHLHWMLPDILMRSSSPDDADGTCKAAGVEFPVVPNRWMITRLWNTQDRNESRKAYFLVKSDYLHCDDDGDSEGIGSVCIPYDAAVDVNGGGDTEDGSASAADLPPGLVPTGTVTIPAGDTSANIVAGTFDDALLKDPGNLRLVLSNLSGEDNDTGPILDNNPVPLTQISVSDARMTERNDLVFTVSLEAPKAADVTVDYEVVLRRMARPFRFLGRSVELNKDGCDPDGPADRLASGLTAAGFGTPMFSSFYPDCHSVFGFHDPELPDHAEGSLQYEVLGWYEDPEADHLGPYLSELADDCAHAEISLADGLEADAGLRMPEGCDGLPDDVRMLLYARVGDELDSAQNIVPTVGDGTVEISIGNTATEALAARLASSIDPDLKDDPGLYEDQLEAISMVDRFAGRRLDIDLKFEEARHSNGFTAQTAGHIWTIYPSTQGGEAQEEQSPPPQITLPQSLADDLDALNLLQSKIERRQAKLGFFREKTFIDWYKYMMAVYPPEVGGDRYPDIDAIRWFIDRFDIPAVDFLSAELERSQADLDCREEALRSDLALASLPDTYQISRDLSKTLPYPMSMTKVAAPSFWEPNEPVVCLTGLPFPGMLHKVTAVVDCTLISINPPCTNLAEFRKSVVTELGLVQTSDWALTDWTTAAAFDPIFLDWDVGVRPMQKFGNLRGQSSRYDPDFIKKNYRLEPDKCTLDPVPGTLTLESAHSFTGRSILTPEAGTGMQESLMAMISTTALADYNDKNEKQMDVEEDGTLSVENASTLLCWYVDNQPDDLATDPVHTALCAYINAVNLGDSVMSQALSGFNEALLMRRQTFQLLPTDPIGFGSSGGSPDDPPGYREWSSRTIRDAVGTFGRNAPLPQNDFNPIRTGELNVNRLRLIDTFGRAADIPVPDKMIVSRTMSHPGGYSEHHAFLKPAITQPSRLNFRFLSAQSGFREMTDHPASSPICGWVMPNHLDQSVMVYDADGQALGSISFRKGGAEWVAAPGGTGVDVDIEAWCNPDDQALKNIDPTLRAMVYDILTEFAEGGKEDFLARLDKALDSIDPEGHEAFTDLAVLIGRPLALIRVRVGIELQGPPATDHSWPTLHDDIRLAPVDRPPVEKPEAAARRQTRAFVGVEFPVRLGESGQLNDGLAGYWDQRRDGDPPEFITPAILGEATDENPYPGQLMLKIGDAAPDGIKMDTHRTVTMLVDPRGQIHATSGILPTKSFAIPPDQFVEALKNIEVTFFTAPILTRTTAPILTRTPTEDAPSLDTPTEEDPSLDTPTEDDPSLDIPLPQEPGYEWSWIERINQDTPPEWNEPTDNPLVPADPSASFRGPTMIRDGWLRLGRSPIDSNTEEETS